MFWGFLWLLFPTVLCHSSDKTFQGYHFQMPLDAMIGYFCWPLCAVRTDLLCGYIDAHTMDVFFYYRFLTWLKK